LRYSKFIPSPQRDLIHQVAMTEQRFYALLDLLRAVQYNSLSVTGQQITIA
jgi:hypothetical protein